MTGHLLCIGGEDHHLRIPFLLRLQDQGFRVSAAGTAPASHFSGTGIPYYPIAFSRFVSPLQDYRSIRMLSGLVGAVAPDLVQCFDTKPCILVPIATRSMSEIDVVSTVNGLGRIYSSSSPLSLAMRPVLEAGYRAASRSVALTIFQNREDHAFFEKKALVKSGRTCVIPGSGVDLDAFDQSADDAASPARVRASLGLQNNEMVITVARMTREKGIPTLLQAAAIAHKRRPSAKFVLVGPFETEGRAAVSRAAIERHAEYVIALGPRSDVPALLRAADLFVLPTQLREGIPRTLLEAAVAGCPIVTTRMPGCADVIKDGWSGLLVPPKRPALLAEKILFHLENKEAARAMGARAAEFARREFSLDLTVERYRAAYESLLRARSGAIRNRHGAAFSSVDAAPATAAARSGDARFE